MATPLVDLLKTLLSSSIGQQFIDKLFVGGTGGNILGFTPSSFDPSKTVGMQYYQQREAYRQSIMFGNTVQQEVRKATQNIVTGFYRGLGYDETRARAEAAAPGMIKDLVVDTFVAPRYQQAAGRISNALYARYSGFSTVGLSDRKIGILRETHATFGRALLSDIMDTASNGGFSGMGISDVGILASEYIRTGGAS